MALAARAEKDGFSYADNSFYREASNLNRHRRATVPELKAHFNGKDTDANRPAHWYEAQLLHYGLAPSKVKGTAHKRLFDAVMKGGLTVPPHIQKIEANLKKEWTKREREAKKMVKESTAAPKTTKGAKRKADQVSAVNVNVSVQVSSTGQVMVQATQPAAKKAKTAPAATAKEKKAALARQTAATATPQAKKATAPQTVRKVTPKEKATAHKVAKAATKATPPTKPVNPIAKGKAMPTQTARRSNPSGSGTASSSAKGGPSSDEPPPPYSEFDTGRGSSSSQVHQQLSSPYLPKLGLLNGRYAVRSRDLDDEFHEYNTDAGFIATVDGRRLWLKFDFGPVVGIMELDRPWGVSDGELRTVWRGTAPEADGDEELVIQDADDDNWVQFLGDGRVRGSISWDGCMAYRFDAERLPDQPMRSEISPSEMRRLYDEYGRY